MAFALGTREKNWDWHPQGVVRSMHFPLYESQVPGCIMEGVKVPYVVYPVNRPSRGLVSLEVPEDFWQDLGVDESFLRCGGEKRTEGLRLEDIRIDREKDAVTRNYLAALDQISQGTGDSLRAA